MQFRIKVPSIQIQRIDVFASSKTEAIRKVEDGDGDYIDKPEYLGQLPSPLWQIERIKLKLRIKRRTKVKKKTK